MEDSLAGIQAAKAGGFRALGYASEHSAAYLQEAGAEIFYSMKELPRFL
ncbi:HAD family hydrolase [Chitinophaga eiseniae]|nr:hypothetical protein [Chitinophaga eiseniae]